MFQQEGRKRFGLAIRRLTGVERVHMHSYAGCCEAEREDLSGTLTCAGYASSCRYLQMEIGCLRQAVVVVWGNNGTKPALQRCHVVVMNPFPRQIVKKRRLGRVGTSRAQLIFLVVRLVRLGCWGAGGVIGPYEIGGSAISIDYSNLRAGSAQV